MDPRIGARRGPEPPGERPVRARRAGVVVHVAREDEGSGGEPRVGEGAVQASHLVAAGDGAGEDDEVGRRDGDDASVLAVERVGPRERPALVPVVRPPQQRPCRLERGPQRGGREAHASGVVREDQAGGQVRGARHETDGGEGTGHGGGVEVVHLLQREHVGPRRGDGCETPGEGQQPAREGVDGGDGQLGHRPPRVGRGDQSTVVRMTDPTSLPNFMPSSPGNTPNGAPASDTPVRDRVVAVLKGLGIEASIDGDGDIEFAIVDNEGTSTTLFARVAEGDLAVVRFFGQWQLAEPVSPDRNERLARCNDLTMQLNIVKLSLVQESLVVSAEHVITPNADLEILVPLSVNHILQSVGFFFQSWLPVDDAPAGPTA